MFCHRSIVRITTIIGLVLANSLVLTVESTTSATGTIDSTHSRPQDDTTPFNKVLLAKENQKRIALVIGNNNYRERDKLSNPINDANDMAQALTELGFEVVKVTDADKKAMDSALQKFAAQLNKGGVGLFYYAGHGLQVDGENYLIPIDAVLDSEKDVNYEALPVGKIQNAMEEAETDVNIIILDACRNNPFGRRWNRSTEIQGLAPIQALTGSFIAFATAPGRYAEDGTGRNGTFTSHILQYIKTPNLSIEELFKRVRQGVSGATDKRQIPWDSSSLIGDFSFNSQATNVAVNTTPTPIPTPTNTTTDSNNAIAYLERGNDYLDTERYDKALTEYNQAIQINPNYAEAYNSRGIVYAHLQQYDKALADFDRAIKIDPSDAKAYNGRGVVYYNLQQYDKALADYARAIQIDPNYANAYSNRGVVYYNLQQYDKALADYARAIQIDPNYANAYYNRSLVYNKLNQPEKALADYNQAIELDPNLAN
jgi:tetratricopeptide (TPR) repeat protein